MSNAKPMTLERRLNLYLPGCEWRHPRESDLTPAQRRRAWHKAHRNGERGSESEVLYGRKGRPTPRRRNAIAGNLVFRRFAEESRG